MGDQSGNNKGDEQDDESKTSPIPKKVDSLLVLEFRLHFFFNLFFCSTHCIHALDYSLRYYILIVFY